MPFIHDVPPSGCAACI